RVIKIGSVAGLIDPPSRGCENASKFAHEGCSESLRHELRPLHIGVSLVEAGFFKTNIGRNRQYGAEPINDYDPWRRRGLSSIERLESQGPGPAAVAECVLRIIESRSPALR